MKKTTFLAVESSWIFKKPNLISYKFSVLNQTSIHPDRCGAASATATRHLVKVSKLTVWEPLFKDDSIVFRGWDQWLIPKNILFCMTVQNALFEAGKKSWEIFWMDGFPWFFPVFHQLLPPAKITAQGRRNCHPFPCPAWTQDILLLLRQRLRQERRYDLADALLEILRPRLEAAGLRLEDDRDTGSEKIEIIHVERMVMWILFVCMFVSYCFLMHQEVLRQTRVSRDVCILLAELHLTSFSGFDSGKFE